MKTVLTYGTFDLFHVGHVKLLQRAAALGDRLYVGMSSDIFNEVKGKKCVIPYKNRAEIVSAIKYVHKVFPENNWEQKIEDISRFGVDVFVMGDDWRGKFDHLKEFCDVTYLERTEGISTTGLKEVLSAFEAEKMKQFKDGVDAIQLIVEQLS
ncbi:MAG: adenylyltransferase/cytidyltransferase family protein [Robiginitomaculum sp.]